jgi:hypothetical protein
MNRFNFENRVSLTRKSEDLINTVDELSSCYEKRLDFVSKNLITYPTSRTSEISTAAAVASFLALAAVLAIAAFYVVAAASMLFWDHNDFNSMVDSYTYKNIV